MTAYSRTIVRACAHGIGERKGPDLTTKKPTSRRRRWLIGSGIGLVVLLGGAYTAAYFLAGDKVPTNTRVEGVAIGGLHPLEAEERLRTELGPRYEAAMTVSDGRGHSISLTPLDSGLSVDYAGAGKAAGGATLNPIDVFKTLLGGGDTELPKRVDAERLSEALNAQAPAFAVEGVDATLSFTDGAISRTESTDSAALDVDATKASVTDAMKSGTHEASATVKVQPPAVTSAMVDEAVNNFATPALSGPVTVNAGDKSFQVTPEQIAAVTTFAAEDGKLVPHLDPDKLLEATAEARTRLGLTTGKNAGYILKDNAIQVVPAEGGQQVDAKGMAEGVAKAAVLSGDARATSVDLIEGAAEFSTEKAESLKPTQVIGEFTTSFPHADYRNKNLGRAAELINGKVLLPGEVFSLNDTLGPRTPDNGFTDGYVINGGLLVKESGGGISQAATTMYNAGFFAGYEDVEHRPHTLYFERYPAGREATIYYGSFDMKFRNNTEYPAYIQGSLTPSTASSKGSLTFRIWSRPTWDKVESTEPEKSNYHSGSERVVDTPNCEPQDPIQGFTATWKRLFYKNGEVAKTEDYSWTYSAGDRVTCTAAGSPGGN